MSWEKVTHKGKRGSPELRKLTGYHDDIAQDGARHSPQGKGKQHGGGYSTQEASWSGESFSTPLQQRNRYDPLSTLHRRTRLRGNLEDSEDECENQCGNPEECERARSPVKPPKMTKSQKNYKDQQRDSGEQQHQSDSDAKVCQYYLTPQQLTMPAAQSPIEPTADPFEDLQANEDPITQTFFKKCMVSFSLILQNGVTEMRNGAAEMRGGMAEIRNDMRKLAGQMSHYVAETDHRITMLEKKVADITIAYNDMVDSHQEVLKELKMQKEKIADAEDRNRRNNIKIRGIPESIKKDALEDYVQKIIKTTLPDIKESDLMIDRIHRLAKPSFIAEHLPRDVILRLHFFHTKDKFIGFTRNGQKLPDPYKHLTLFNDYSQATLKARKEYADVSTTLRSKGINYSWSFPTKMKIYNQDRVFIIRSVNEGYELLKKWGIPITQAKTYARTTYTKPQSNPSPMDTTQPPTEENKSAEATKGNVG